jgi:hypothetical protein
VAENVIWMVCAGHGAAIVGDFRDAASVGIAGTIQSRVDTGFSVAA